MAVHFSVPYRLQSNGQWVAYGYPLVDIPAGKWNLLELTGSTVAGSGGGGGGFVVGTTFPDSTNTGIPAGVSMNGIITGSSTGTYAPAAGSYIYRQEIRNYVDLAQDVVLEQCRIVGRAPGGSFRDNLVTGTGTSPGAKMIRCEIAPSQAAGVWYMNCIGGKNIETNQCNIYNGVDSWNSSGGEQNLWSYGDWSHHKAMYMYDGTTLGGPGTSGGDHASDTRKPGWTHNDDFQGAGGGGHRFIGTRMDGVIAHADGAHTSHAGYIANACGNWSVLYADSEFGWAAGAYAGMWGAGFTISPKSGIVTGEITNCWLDGQEVLFQMPFQGGSNPSSGCNWSISGNRLGLTHPYASGKRFEQMRMTAGMGTITVSSPNVYGNFASVTGLSGTPTTTPSPIPGNIVAGTFGSGSGTGTTTALSYTTRLA